MAWQLAEMFRAEVYRLVLGSAAAKEDLRYRSQILEAADGVGINVAEGFLSRSPGDFCRFLDYALSSLGEAERRLKNGIHRSYFDAALCGEAFLLARRALTAIIRLKASQTKRIAEQRKKRTRR